MGVRGINMPILMRYAYIYVFTCCILPFFWGESEQVTQADPEHIGKVCECCMEVVEPNVHCLDFHTLNHQPDLYYYDSEVGFDVHW